MTQSTSNVTAPTINLPFPLVNRASPGPQGGSNLKIPIPTQSAPIVSGLPPAKPVAVSDPQSWTKTLQMIDTLGKFKRKSFLRVLIKPFKKFLRLLHILKKTELKHEARIKFLNNIIRFSPDSPKGSTVDILKATLQTFKELKDPSLKSSIQTLRKTLAYTQKLEKLKKNKRLKPNSLAIKGLIKQQTKDLERVTKEQPLLLPLSWKEEDKMAEGWLKVSKNDAGSYHVQVISMSDQLRAFSNSWKDGHECERFSPIYSFDNLSLDKLKESIPGLVQLQMHRKSDEKKAGPSGLVSKMITMFQVMNKTEGDDKKLPTAQNVTPLHHLQDIFGQDPVACEEKDSEKLASQQSFKEVMLFFKGHMPRQQFKTQKLKLEIQALAHAFKEGNNSLKHPSFRQALRESIYRLEKEIQKQQVGMQPDQVNQLHRSLQTILSRVEEAEKKYSEEGIGKPKCSKWTKQFSVESASWAKERVAGSKPAAASKTHAFAKIDFNSPHQAWETATQAIAALDDLYTAGDWSSLELGVTQLVRQLPPPCFKNYKTAKRLHSSYPDFWKTIPAQDRSKWQERFAHLAKLSFEAYRMQEQHPAAPELIISTTYLQTLINDLSRHKGKGNEAYQVDFRTLEFLEKNCYFRTKNPLLQAQIAVIADVRNSSTDGWGCYSDWKPKEDYENPNHPKSSLFWAFQCQSVARTMMHDGKNLNWFNGILSTLGAVKELAGSFDGNLPNMSPEQVKRKYDEVLTRIEKRGLIKPHPIKKGKRVLPKWTFHKMANGPQIAPQIYCGGYADSNRVFEPVGSNYRKLGRTVSDEIDQKVIQFNLSTTNEKNSSKLTPSGIEVRAGSPKEATLKHMQVKEDRLAQTLTTFTQQPELLDDSSSQRVFELNFLAQGQLFEMIEQKPETMKDLALFIEESFRMALATSNLPRACFLLNCRETLRNFILFSDVDATQSQDLLATLATQEKSDQDLQLLISQATTLEQKQLVALTFFSIFKERLDLSLVDPNTLSDDQLKQLVNLQFTLQKAPVPAKYANGSAMQDVNQSMRLVSGRMQQAMQSVDFRKSVLSPFFPAHLDYSKMKGCYPRFYLGDNMVDFDKGTCYYKNKREGQLADTVAEHPDVLQAASDLTSIDAIITLCQSRKGEREIVEYQLKDPKQTRIITSEGNAPLIQRQMPISKRKNKQMDFIPPTDVLSYPSEIVLLANGNHLWKNSSKPTELYIYNKAGTQLLYRIQLSKKNERFTLKSIRREADGLRLLPVDLKRNQRALKKLGSLDSQGHILLWGTARGRLKEVAYPRLKLSDGNPIAYRIEGKKIVSAYHPKRAFSTETLPLKTALDVNGTSYQIDYLPTLFANYHKCDEVGKPSQVLIPIKPFRVAEKISSTEEQQVLSWAGAPLVHQDYRKGGSDVAVFELDPITHKLHSKDKRALLFLAYVFLSHKQYDKALELFKQAETDLLLSPEQIEIYNWISKWKDPAPEAAAFRLRANALLLKRNPPQEPEELQMAAIELKTSFTRYSASKKSLAKGLRLNRKEKETIEELLDRTGLSFIDINYSTQTTEAVQKVVSKLEKPKDLDMFVATEELFMSVRSYGGDHLSLNPDQRLKKGFVALYEGIYKANPKQLRALKTQVYLFQPETPTGVALRFILQGLIHLKETNSTLLPTLKFPRKALPCPIRFIRLIQLGGKKPDMIRDLFNKIERAIPNAPAAPAQQDPKVTGGWDQTGFNADTMQRFGVQDPGAILQLSDTEREEWLKKQEVLARKQVLDGYLAQVPAQPFSNYTALTAYSEGVLPSSSAQKPASMSQEGQKLSSDDASRFLKNYAHNFAAQNPAAANMAQELAQDVGVHFQNGSQVGYLLSKEDVHGWKTALAEDVASGERKIKEASTEVLRLLQRGANLAQNLRAVRNGAIPNALIILFRRSNLGDVNKLYGLNLSADELNSLNKAVVQYMQGSVDLRHAKRVQDQVQLLTDKKEALTEEELTELVNLRWTKRFYNPYEDNRLVKAMLAIEFYTGFILREKQANTIEHMLRDPTQVRQLGMGEGKSSVIVPIVLDSFADGVHLAVGIVPDALYQIVSEDLDSSSKGMLGQDIYRFEFSRDSSSTQEDLTRVYNDLAGCIKNKRAVLTTRTFLLSYKNKFIELNKRIKDSDKQPLSPNQRADIEARLSIMGETFALLKTRGIVIADEIDSILNVRDELNYATGDMEGLSSKKTEAGLELFEMLLNWRNSGDQRLTNYAQKILMNEQAGLGAEGIADLRQSLAHEIVTRYNLTRSNAVIYYLSGAGTKPGDFDQNFLRADGIPHFMHQIKQSKPELYQKLSLMRQFLEAGLKTTLERTGNEDFGRSENNIDICVYAAANTPSKARFGEAFELIPYYIQDYIQVGINSDQAVQYVDTVVNTIEEEMRAQLLEHGTMPTPESTVAYQNFQAEFQANPMLLKRSAFLIEQFRQKLNASPESRLAFLSRYVLPTVKMAAKQVTSNPHDLVEMFFTFGGFSGTPYNAKTYSKAINIANASTPGTDGKTVAILKKQEQAGEIQIKVIPTEAMRQPVEGLTKYIPEFFTRYNAFTDLGGTLKGISNFEAAILFESAAQKAAKDQKIELSAVGFVDEKTNRKMIREFGKEVQPLAARNDIAPKKRLFIYSQAHTIGTDVVNDPNARCAVTIGPKTLIKDLFQAIWRMRRIDKGQKVDFIFTDDVAQLIRAACKLGAQDSITIDHILLFALVNQSELVADDTARSDRQRMQAIAQFEMTQQLVMATLDPQLADVRESLYALYEKHLLKIMGDDYDAFARVNGIDETPLVLERYKQSLITRFTGVAQELVKLQIPQEFQASFQKSLNVLKSYQVASAQDLPKYSQDIPQDNSGSQVEVQQQQQQQISIQTQQQTMASGEADWVDWVKPGSSFKSMYEFINATDKLAPLAPVISNQLKFSPNLAKTATEAAKKNSHPPLLLCAIVKKFGKMQVVLVDQNDYDKYLAKTWGALSEEFAVFDIRADRKAIILQSSGLNKTLPSKTAQEKMEWMELVVQTKVMAGHFNFYDKEEKAALERWVKGHPDRKQLAKFIEESCVASGQLAEYRKSKLHALVSV